MYISSISDSIQCPVRLVYTLNLGYKKITKRSDKNVSHKNYFTNDANLTGITKGKIFECSIQYIMTSIDKDSVFEEVSDWFYDISDFPKRSLNQSSPPWDSEWIEDERVLNHKLGSNSWDKLYSAVNQWYKGDKPWDGQKINWEREKPVRGKIDFEGIFPINLSGRIDLFATAENKHFVVELKHTKEDQLQKARAQASLYVKLLKLEYSNDINGFVYHSHKGVIEAFSDEEWQRIISEGQESIYHPNIFVCEKCPNLNCSERINDARII